MDTIFKDEKTFDGALKEFFKTQIVNHIPRKEYDDDAVYTKVLMDEFKRVYRSYREIGYYLSILWLFSGVLLPFYLLFTIENRDFATIAFFVIWILVFAYFSNGNGLKEPQYLLRSKIQAYKELLREVSGYWYISKVNRKSKPNSRMQMKAAMNIEKALSQMPEKKVPLSLKEKKFRDSLGVRLKRTKPR